MDSLNQDRYHLYHISALIRLHRIKNGYSLRQLSMKTHITHTAINQLEFARNKLDDLQIKELCHALKIDDTLLYENNDAILHLFNLITDSHFYRINDFERIDKEIIALKNQAPHSILYVKYLLSLFIYGVCKDVNGNQASTTFDLLNQVTWKNDDDDYHYFLLFTTIYYMETKKRDKALEILLELEQLNVRNQKILALLHTYASYLLIDRGEMISTYNHLLKGQEYLRNMNCFSRVISGLTSLGNLMFYFNEDKMALHYFSEAKHSLTLLNDPYVKSFYHRTIAYYYMNKRDWNKAIDYFYKVDLVYDHAESKYYFWLAWSFIQINEFEEAKEKILKGKETVNYYLHTKSFEFLENYLENTISEQTKEIGRMCYNYYLESSDYRSSTFFKNTLIDIYLEDKDALGLMQFIEDIKEKVNNE